MAPAFEIVVHSGPILKLLPFTEHAPGMMAVSNSLLECGRHPAFYERLQESITSTSVPPIFLSFLGKDRAGETRYGETPTDDLDQPLQCVPAGALTPFGDDPEVQGNPHTRAAWAYLSALSPETPVALFWTT